MQRIALFTAVALASLASQSIAVTRNVPSGMYPTIQAGVNAANNGDTVLVSAGNYFGPGNVDVDLLGKAITVLGDGGSQLCTINCGGSVSAPHRAFNLGNGEGPATLIKGFTIEGGYGPDFDFDGDLLSIGGAVACFASSPTFEDISFENNSAGYGGAVSAGFGSAPTFRLCYFYGNSATAFFLPDGPDGIGGGLLAFQSSPKLYQCAFDNNYANWGGGAISIDSGDGGTIMIDSCLFFMNVGDSSGGAINVSSLSPTNIDVTGSIFVENVTSWIGGAAYAELGGADLSFTNCTFALNEVDTSGSGGGAGSVSHVEEGANISYSHCIMYDNRGVSPLECSNGFYSIQCTDIFGNAGGDWVGCVSGFEALNSNFSQDPQFCDPLFDNYFISSSSPCAPANSACGALVGMLDVQCAAQTCCDTPGDFNNDGSVNIGDVTGGIAHLFNGAAGPVCAEEGDANSDNKYNIADITHLVAWIFNGGPDPLCAGGG